MQTLVLACAVVLVSTSCVRAQRPTAELIPLQANVVFGNKPAPERVLPANFAISSDDLGQTSPLEDDYAPLPTRVFEDLVRRDPRPPTTTPPPAAAGPCPTAPLGSFAREQAPLNVPPGRLPAAGIYRWQRAGTVKGPSGTVFLQGLEERLIRNVKLISDQPRPDDSKTPPDPAAPPLPRMQYSFEVVQPEVGSGNVVVTTYLVDTNAPGTKEETTPVGAQRVVAGSPERGLTIKKIERLNPQGNPLPGAFAPATGLLIAPLPIRGGETFTGVGIDPVTMQTMRYEGRTLQRNLIDACGEIIQGWSMDGTLTISGSGSTEQVTQRFTLMMAPHLGAIPIQELYQSVGGEATTARFTIGQRQPGVAR